MVRYLLLLLMFAVISSPAKADHITGGEMYYTYIGFSNGLYQYSVTLKLYMRCNSGRSFPDPTVVSIFDKGNNERYQDVTVQLANQVTISLTDVDPCISNPPNVCYEVAYYHFTIDLPSSQEGYLLASQVNYRINGMANLNASQVGATYTSEIPGNFSLISGPSNNSAIFTGSDLVVVCADNSFTYSFSASDPDNDQLRYSFCSALNSSNGGTNGSATGEPPFNGLPYDFPEFSESFPLGLSVNIDPSTGLITGIAPGEGQYVVTVCVEEIRGDMVIATQRKDIQINIADCDLVAATLQPDYMLCGTSRSLSINNIAVSPLITSQDWQIKEPDGTIIFESDQGQLNYTFSTNGTYTIKLVVNRGEPCSDSTESKVYVYPGFEPGFDFNGICINKPTFFHDRSTTVTGTVNSWRWDFGEAATTLDVAQVQNPEYTYPSLGLRDVRLIVTNTDGCRDTIVKDITIIDKPPLLLAFRDTLICLGDRLQLQANGPGSYSWTPAIGVVNPNTSMPTVSPASTTMYYGDLNSDGCLNRDSVLVRVVDHVTLSTMPDSTICIGDTIQLRINSDALKYSWTPASFLLDPTIKNPQAISTSTTEYEVTATIGGCSATGQIEIRAVPYPFVNAGDDVTICFGSTVRLSAITDGNSWQWTPHTNISDIGALNPLVNPGISTSYILTAFESTRGCPKAGRDTLLVTVLEEVKAFAGNDTSVVIGQMLQFSATGGIRYEWSPSTSLSSAEIPNPFAVYSTPSEGIRYQLTAYDENGCSDTDFMTVRIFNTVPTIFVPTAFTPNNDGRNDVLKPIPAGIARIEYFMIYNRWGQLLFRSNSENPGWDGRVNGQMQGSNTFVWLVKAIDYKGDAYFQKGTVVLIQ